MGDPDRAADFIAAGEDAAELLDAAEALERATWRRWVESLPPLAQAEPTQG